jgi:hypothetical protein
MTRLYIISISKTYVIRVTRRVPLKEQELLTIPEKLSPSSF